MKTLFTLRGSILVCVAASLIIYVSIACKRKKSLFTQQENSLSSNVTKIKNWWDNRRKTIDPNQSQILSRVPDGVSIQNYWQNQFQNGIPKWSDVRVSTVNDETIYEVPFEFPDNLILLNDKPDAPPQFYITSKNGANAPYKTSHTYLIVKEKPGTANVAEIMCIVLDNSYIKILDSIATGYPTVRITNVYPAPNNLGEFTGSVKFYDLDGLQILDEGYVSGSLQDYVQYGRCNFLITPVPNLPTIRMYSVCKWTTLVHDLSIPEPTVLSTTRILFLDGFV